MALLDLQIKCPVHQNSKKDSPRKRVVLRDVVGALGHRSNPGTVHAGGLAWVLLQPPPPRQLRSVLTHQHWWGGDPASAVCCTSPIGFAQCALSTTVSPARAQWQCFVNTLPHSNRTTDHRQLTDKQNPRDQLCTRYRWDGSISVTLQPHKFILNTTVTKVIQPEKRSHHLPPISGQSSRQCLIACCDTKVIPLLPRIAPDSS